MTSTQSTTSTASTPSATEIQQRRFHTRAALTTIACTGCGAPQLVDEDTIRWLCGMCVLEGRSLTARTGELFGGGDQ